MTSVLFVCLGNICRSPTAEGVFRHLCEGERLAGRIAIDSAGTGSWHVGDPPDRRAQAAARRRGIDMSAQRARQVQRADFQRFDYVLAMDRSNLEDLRDLCPDDFAGHLGLFLDFAPEASERDVPDPYYGGADGFDEVLDLIETASRGLLDEIRRTL
jgi:protein-tyrosine phosphatase